MCDARDAWYVFGAFILWTMVIIAVYIVTIAKLGNVRKAFL
jgi:hypothetical protein